MKRTLYRGHLNPIINKPSVRLVQKISTPFFPRVFAGIIGPPPTHTLVAAVLVSPGEK